MATRKRFIICDDDDEGRSDIKRDVKPAKQLIYALRLRIDTSFAIHTTFPFAATGFAPERASQMRQRERQVIPPEDFTEKPSARE